MNKAQTQEWENVKAIDFFESTIKAEVLNEASRIKFERAVMALERLKDICGRDEKMWDMINDRYKFGAWLEDLKSREWHLADKELPKEAYACFVTVEEDDRNGEPQRVVYPEFVGYDGQDWVDAEGRVIPFEVVAWQPRPLPLPFEEREEEHTEREM